MALMAAIFRPHRPIVTRQVIVGGQKVIQKVVRTSAKPYVMPSRPDLRREELYRTIQ